MKIAVLMTCHNRVRTTIDCLRRLLVAIVECGEDVNVWLVDDGSTDGTGDQVRALLPDVHVITGNGKLYWSRGMHLAWETAAECGKYDFYLWLNDDVMLKSDALKMALDDWRKCGDERGVIVGACSEDVDNAISSYGATDEKDARIIPNGAPQCASGWFNGNVVLIPYGTYEKVGIISDEYSHGRADYDYAERLKEAGVPFFCSSQYVGVCHRDFSVKMSAKSRWGRFAALWHPGSLNLRDLWVFRSKYYGIPRAIASCLHAIIIRLKG